LADSGVPEFISDGGLERTGELVRQERVLLRQEGDSPREEKPRRASASMEFNILHGSTNSSAAKSLEDSHFLSFWALQVAESNFSRGNLREGRVCERSSGERVSGRLETW